MSAPNRKSRRARQTAALLAALLAASVRPARAQARAEGPLVLRLPVSARLLGMGGAGLAGTDADALLTNPGLLPGARGLATSVQRYGTAATAGALATVTTLGVLTVGVGAQWLDWHAPHEITGGAGDVDARRFGATHLSDGGGLPSSSTAFTLGLGRAVKGWRLGASAKYAEDRIGLTHGGTAAVDLGVAKPLWRGTLGIVAQNLGAGAAIGGVTGTLPTRLGIGFGGGPITLSPLFDIGAQLALMMERDGFVRPAGGAELSYVPIEGVQLTVRSGLRLPRERDEPLATAGLGVTVDRLSIDYAIEPMRGGRPVSHRVGLRIK